MGKLVRTATRQNADACGGKGVRNVKGHFATSRRLREIPLTLDSRCIRLKKICEPSDSVRKRNTQPTTAEVSDTRIARLEDKMENLLSAMESFIGSPGTPVSSMNGFQPPKNGNFSSSTVGSHAAVVTPSSVSNESDGPALVAESIAGFPQNPMSWIRTHQQTGLSRSFPLSNQSEDRLSYFRSRMLPSFPFIDFTADMTGWYLRKNRPVLLQAILTVTTFSTQERLVQVEELKRLLFTSALLEVQSNIDILLGTLTYIAWNTDAFLGRSNLLSRLMMLAISLVYDLRLFKPSSPDVQLMMTITQGREEESSQSPSGETMCGLLERQRAVLACFMLSSKYARLF